MTSGTQVRFVCRALEHAQTGRDPEGGVLTIEDGKWALCPWGQTDRHAWTPVEPVDVDTARRTESIAQATNALRSRRPA